MFSGKVYAKYDNEIGIALKGMIGGTIKRVIPPIRPYMFIKKDDKPILKRVNGWNEIEDTDLKYRDDDGKEYDVVKVIIDDLGNFSNIRNKMRSVGIETFESNIPFVRRLLIDNEYSVDYDGRVCYLDIEIDDSRGFPKTYGDYEIISIAVCDGSMSDWFYVKDYDSEKQMLATFCDWLQSNEKTIMAGWNVAFDYNHLMERTRNLNIRSKWIFYMHTIDLMDKYKGAVKGLESYSLEEASINEDFVPKSRTKKIHEMSRDELEEYNVYDAELCRLIDERYGFTELDIELAKYINLPIDELSPIKMADSLVIRKLRENGYVAKDVGDYKDQSYSGAWVKAPDGGVHKNVIYLDYESMYPNIILHECIDIDGFKGEIMPEIIAKSMEMRRNFKNVYKETGEKKWDVKQKAMKVITNSLYGVFGNKYFRYVNYASAGKITERGRRLVRDLENFVEEMFGMKVIYADTDSAMVKANGVGDVNAFAEILANEVNAKMNPYRVKVEDIFKRIIFVKSGKTGAKKRYVALTDSGELVWRGLEKRRSDWCRLAKEIQENVARMILIEEKRRDDVLKYLAEIKEDLRKGIYDDKLIITKGIRTEDDYKVDAPHVRAWRKSSKTSDNMISYVWIGGDVMPIENVQQLEKYRGRLDYKYYWQRMIYPPVKRILDSIDNAQQKLFI